MEFKDFAAKIEQQAKALEELGTLYVVNIDKDEAYEHYLSSFPIGTNEIYRERSEHDCSTCKSFIRNAGNIVTIDDDLIVHTIWDIEAEGEYQVVADAMSTYVTSAEISSKAFAREAQAGCHHNIEVLPQGDTIKWHHLNYKRPDEYVVLSVGEAQGEVTSRYQVFSRGLETITLDAIETYEELVTNKLLYRGDEFLDGVKQFKKLLVQYQSVPEDKRSAFCWKYISAKGNTIRNTVAGTLLVDLSEGVPLEDAVKAFESKVAGENYKRPKALVTPRMSQDALKKFKELGVEESMYRRYARLSDVSVNDVIYVDNDTSTHMLDPLAQAMQQGVTKPTVKINTKNVKDITIDKFVTEVLPKATRVEAFVENSHEANFVSLIAPKFAGAPNILKWDNNFSWSYNGDITDSSTKQLVKAKGGKVDGVLRFSIRWNDDKLDRNIDFDAHCIQPHGIEISFRGDLDHKTKGNLDVDIMTPGTEVAVENITWPELRCMHDGKYEFFVHNYSSAHSTKGFTAQIEFNGQMHEFVYDKVLIGNEKVPVASGILDKTSNTFTLMQNVGLKPTTAQKDVWGISTGTFSEVSLVTLSPNYWGGNQIGNKHFLFMLKECKNPDAIRGLYNEFLSNEFTTYRKQLEMLGKIIRCEESDDQISGLGFSSTKGAELVVKVAGEKAGMYKIKFNK